MKKPKLVTALGASLLVMVVVMWNREHIFTLDVSTEVAAFTITDPILAEWTLEEARLIDDPFASDEQGIALEPSSLLLLDPGTQVRVQRHGMADLRILLQSEKAVSVGRIESETGQQVSLSDWALLLVTVRQRPLVFPFRGTLTVGDDVAIGVDSILLSGSVRVVEEQLLGNTHYLAGIEELDAGDRVQMRHKDRRVAIVEGFVRAEPMDSYSEPIDALKLVAHGQADYVQVYRLGSAGYQVRAPRWARFLHDPLLAAVAAIVTLLAVVFELSSTFVELVGRTKQCATTGAGCNQDANETTS